jgi:hypothetical protein
MCLKSPVLTTFDSHNVSIRDARTLACASPPFEMASFHDGAGQKLDAAGSPFLPSPTRRASNHEESRPSPGQELLWYAAPCSGRLP